ERDADRIAGAEDEAGENVAADLIGTEQEFGAARLIGIADDLRLAIGSNEWREQRAEHVDQDHDHAEPSRDRCLFELAPSDLAPRTADSKDGSGGGFGGHLGCSRRGLVMIEMMSAE